MEARSLTVAVDEDVEAITTLVGTELFESDDFLGVGHGKQWRREEEEKRQGSGGCASAKGAISITNGLISIRRPF